MPLEFFPKDERSLQEHLGPHSQAPDVGGGDNEAGVDRGGWFHVNKLPSSKMRKLRAVKLTD